MKNKILNIFGIIAVLIAGIVSNFLLKGKEMQIGIKSENMMLSAKPGDDFYDYATGGWRKNNPIPDDYTRWTSFHMLDALNLERVREIAEQDNGKIGTLYKIAMDSEKLNKENTSPVESYLKEIDNIKNKKDLAKYLGKMHTFSSAFWGDGVLLDDKDSEHYIFVIGQGGIGLSRDYFFDKDEKSKEVRTKYKKYMKDIMNNFGIKADVKKLYAFEERMAKSFYEKEKLRDPLINYHKKSYDELKKDMPAFDWDLFFEARGVKPEFVNIEQIEPIAESIAIMNDTELELIKTYLKYRIVNSATGLLDDKTYDIAFDFYNRVLSGQKEQKPRWKRSVDILDGSLGEEIGQLYVKKYFSESAKKRMTELVENLRRAYEIRINNLDWMSDETKKQALAKLKSFKAKIGYPNKWRDYSNLEIKNDSLFENMMRVAAFEDAFWLEKVGKKKDPEIWYMNAHEINAYYDPSTNEICFPAGILQNPFFDMNADDAFNYGAIGSVIGHEMTHGFDDSGRHFDKDGNMNEWWTKEDAKHFEVHANIMKDYFNNIIVAPNVHANGEFTLGENLADYGGVTISYTAYKNFGKKSEDASGFTADQRFFLAFAMTEAGNIRDDELIRLTKTNEHSLSRWRVNGILPHVNAWYEVFNITPNDKMYIEPEKRVNLW
ncbi:MAG: M13 family metallopeptidase [Alphaproteobacteria bacterium]|nr:M13 family metallopeptidase [Alphaproteobacteria bacterium]